MGYLSATLGEVVARRRQIAIEQGLHERRDVLGPERPHRDCEVQVVVERPQARLALHHLSHLLRRILRIGQPRRDAHPPIGEAALDRIQPRLDPRLARVDLLPATHQTDDHRPVRVSVHVAHQELGLRLAEPRQPLPPLHEGGRLLLGPGALRLVEDDDVLGSAPRGQLHCPTLSRTHEGAKMQLGCDRTQWKDDGASTLRLHVGRTGTPSCPVWGTHTHGAAGS